MIIRYTAYINTIYTNISYSIPPDRGSIYNSKAYIYPNKYLNLDRLINIYIWILFNVSRETYVRNAQS